jgi:hypothetical protein
MAQSILCRLAYLVTPKQALRQTLALEESSRHEVCQPTTVITPILDYEEAFEGWKRSWLTKAKQDFVSNFARTWSDEFSDFVTQLRPTDSFDHWWSMSEISVIEIDSKWKPWKP